MSSVIVRCKTVRLMDNAVQSVESQTTFRSNILPPSSGSKNKSTINQCEALLATCFFLVFSFGLLFKIKLWATYSSETSVEFQSTTKCYILGDRTLHFHRCGNLKSYIRMIISEQNFAKEEE
jgi:hypothetical protein